jgi:hypothetical protein
MNSGDMLIPLTAVLTPALREAALEFVQKHAARIVNLTRTVRISAWMIQGISMEAVDLHAHAASAELRIVIFTTDGTTRL